MDFSIIVPAYNVEKYIAACLDSLAQQSYPVDRYEVIVVNDGSTDGTKSVIESRIGALKNFRLIDQRNGGVSSARNRGIESARGRYLLFVDGDDTIQTNVLQQVNSFIDMSALDLAHFNIINDTDPEFLVEPGELKANGDCMPGWEYYLHYRRIGNARDTACTTFFRKELLDNYSIRFTAEARYLEDGEFLAKAFAVADRCRGSLFPLYIRTHRSDSATRSKIQMRKNVIEGIFCSALSLNAFRNKYAGKANEKVMNQVIVKFVTLCLMQSVKRFDLVTYFRFYREFKRKGLSRLNHDGATMNFPALAEAYNKGQLNMLFYSISRTGPYTRFRKALFQK